MEGGRAHRLANAANALPPLELSFRRKDDDGNTQIVSRMDEVAEHYTKPWAGEWQGNEDAVSALRFELE